MITIAVGHLDHRFDRWQILARRCLRGEQFVCFRIDFHLMDVLFQLIQHIDRGWPGHTGGRWTSRQRCRGPQLIRKEIHSGLVVAVQRDGATFLNVTQFQERFAGCVR